MKNEIAPGVAGPEGRSETSGVRGPLPPASYKRPTIVLDSGQSVDESAFCEAYRRWLHHRISRPSSDPSKAWRAPRVWLLYPHKRLWGRFGSAPVNEYDEWEVRPVRWHRDPYPQGHWATVSVFEDGSYWDGHESPWRRPGGDWEMRGRAAYVYFNPTAQDIRWATRHTDFWHHKGRMPVVYLGQTTSKMPGITVSHCGGVMSYSRGKTLQVDEAMGRRFSTRVWWEKMWDTEKPKHRFSCPGGWRHDERIRWPSIFGKWAESVGSDVFIPQDNGTWEELEEATSCEYYVVLSTRETMPFDAMMAAARGATVIGPDIPIYRELFDHKWLYPVVHQGHDVVAWGQADVREWFLNRFS